MICKGIPWICGAGQARPDAPAGRASSTYARPEGPSRHPIRWRIHSLMTWGEYGGFAGIDMRHSLEAYAERYLAWANRPWTGHLYGYSGLGRRAPAAWSAARLESHLPEGTGERHRCRRRGFSFQPRPTAAAPSTHVFCSIRQTTFPCRILPSSTRTFAGGQTVDFPGDRHITARFESGPRLRILVALAVLDADAPPPPLMEWQDPDIRLDAERVWAFPFKGAILKTVRLGQHVSNLQRAPAGE